jgi:hypothetical protein
MNTVCDDLVNIEASRQGGLSHVQSCALVLPETPGHVNVFAYQAHTPLAAPRRSMSLSPGFVKLSHRKRSRARHTFPNAVDVAHGGAPPVQRSRMRLPGR